MNIYTENGYKNRNDYLEQLSEEYGHDIVHAIALAYGPSEDFDGLVTTLKDME